MKSPADSFLKLPLAERQVRLSKLSRMDRARLLYDWHFWARPEQQAPTATAEPGTYWRYVAASEPGSRCSWQPAVPSDDWTYWVCNAGRGWGKTRTGAEWTRRKIRTTNFVNLIAPTAADVRDVMVEGPSGILACCSRDERPKYEPSNRRLLWPNGAISTTFSADEPDRLRGPSHGALWADELGSWRYAEAWDQAQFGLRLGDRPQACITTTPKPVPVFKAVLSDPGAIVSRGTTRENVRNLARTFLTNVVGKYIGTRLGRQELDAELLEDNPGALWKRNTIDLTRVAAAPATLVRVVIAIDPMGSVKNPAAECGIVAMGKDDRGHGYVLADGSMAGKPNQWGDAAVLLYRTHAADRIVAEVNFGGDMVEAVILTVDRNVPYREVHASRGKAVRAEPVAALYEQGRMHHVGFFAKLEDEMCDWDPSDSKAPSPNRMDALVWAATELFLGEQTTGMLDWLTAQTNGGEAEPVKPALPSQLERLPVVNPSTAPVQAKTGRNFYHGDE